MIKFANQLQLKSDKMVKISKSIKQTHVNDHLTV